MANVRILQSVSGEHFSWPAGIVVAMPDDEAEKWADNFRGVLVGDDAEIHQLYDPASIPVVEVLVDVVEIIDNENSETVVGESSTSGSSEGVPAVPAERPADDANKPVWVAYAAGLGVDVEGLTKAEIIAAVDAAAATS